MFKGCEFVKGCEPPDWLLAEALAAKRDSAKQSERRLNYVPFPQRAETKQRALKFQYVVFFCRRRHTTMHATSRGSRLSLSLCVKKRRASATAAVISDNNKSTQ